MVEFEILKVIPERWINVATKTYFDFDPNGYLIGCTISIENKKQKCCDFLKMLRFELLVTHEHNHEHNYNRKTNSWQTRHDNASELPLFVSKKYQFDFDDNDDNDNDDDATIWSTINLIL